MNKEQFLRYSKARSANFLCFSTNVFADLLDPHHAFISHAGQKAFCELMSFVSLRFISKVLFEILRKRNEGELKNP